MIEVIANFLDQLSITVQKTLLLIIILFSLFIHLHLGISLILIIAIAIITRKYRKQEYFQIEESSSILFLCGGIPFFYQLISTIAYLLLRLYLVLSVIGLLYLDLYYFKLGWLWSLLLIPISFIIFYIINQLLLRQVLNIKKGEKIYIYMIDLDKRFKGILFYEDY